MTQNHHRAPRAGGVRGSAVNARRFLARSVIYEADGELRVYDLPDALPADEAIADFERATKLRYDPDDGIWRKPCVGRVFGGESNVVSEAGANVADAKRAEGTHDA